MGMPYFSETALAALVAPDPKGANRKLTLSSVIMRSADCTARGPSHTCQSRPRCVSRTETCPLLAHYAIFFWSFARRRSRSTPRISGSSNRRLRRSGLCEGRMAFRVPGRRGSISDVGSHAISPIPPTATECMRSNEMSLRANRGLMHCNRRCPRWQARGVGHLVCGCGNCQIVHDHCGRGRQTPETSDGDDQTPHVRGGVRCRRDDAYAQCTRWLGAE